MRLHKKVMCRTTGEALMTLSVLTHYCIRKMYDECQHFNMAKRVKDKWPR